MWHPQYDETQCDTAGVFLHFRRRFTLDTLPSELWIVQLSADTKYKLYINHQYVTSGPVKGDETLWFFDEIDITPFLRIGVNHIGIHVLRFYYATAFAPSFPRTPYGGVMIKSLNERSDAEININSSSLWETAVDHRIILPVDIIEDDFLHVYERSSANASSLKWVSAKLYRFQTSTGHTPPWKLQKRMIPVAKRSEAKVHNVHNVNSSVPAANWLEVLKGGKDDQVSSNGITLPANTKHLVELESELHMTAFLKFRFKKIEGEGSTLTVTYSESYEDQPTLVPYLRRKEHRLDFSKSLYGPQDYYSLQSSQSSLEYRQSDTNEAIVAPFHFRTFRFLKIEIEAGSSDLVFNGIDIERTNYPLDVRAKIETEDTDEGRIGQTMWDISVRTLENCMHDCYEDCPFYEQLQYAMDTRNSILFTYYISGDDRLSRQAIIQLHNSYNPRDSLTASRAPSHVRQLIPHFSLFWIMMLQDHLTYFDDKIWLKQFLPVVDGVLQYFNSHIDPKYGLVKLDMTIGIWNFVDWTELWRPFGIPPAAERTGFCTYTNCLYAYVLIIAANMLQTLGRSGLAMEYEVRAASVICATNAYCFDGTFYTDGLAKGADPAIDYSQHSQFWAVLCGATSGVPAQELLNKTIHSPATATFTKTSISMAFYALRAASAAGGAVYDRVFSSFWDPWKRQIELGLTTWEEDSVSQRSDCHAWGSAPIFEYMAEVAGITPKSAGWSSVRFQPRLQLLPFFKAEVPCGRWSNGVQRLAHVEWRKNSAGMVEVSLDLRPPEGHDVTIFVNVPGQAEFVWNGGKGWLQMTVKV